MHSAKHSMMDLIHENIIKPQSTEAKIFIEKVGVYPKIEIEVDKTLNKYFDRETRQWYYKALKSLNENLGIGAYAYFRRIIEKELIQIVKNISTDISNNSDKIKNLLTQFDKHNKVHLLYENIYQYLRNPSV